MIFLGLFILGFGIGWRRAQKRGGALADRVQYGLAHGAALALGVAVLAQIAALAGFRPV